MSQPRYVNELLALTGCDAFTLLIYDLEKGVALRVFSSCPEEFPTEGSKVLTGSVWAEWLLTQMAPLVSEGPEALKRNFDDHEVIMDLGIKAIINFPILRQGKCIGAVNCLYYSMPKWTNDQAIADRASWLAGQIIGRGE